ncbi:MAG: ComEC/Rec2 family competence protein [Ilumatobacteraceae bacterium]
MSVGPSPSIHLGDGALSAITVAFVVGVWSCGTWPSAVVVAVASSIAVTSWLLRRGRAGGLVLVAGAILVVGGVLGERAWSRTEPERLGAFRGWAVVVDDPSPIGRGQRVTVEIEDERFALRGYGRVAGKVARLAAGERVWIEGRRTALVGSAARRAAVRHIVGDVDVDLVGDVLDGAPAARAANRVRRLLRAAAEATMSDDIAALFTGLVVGDDARQSPQVVDDFRASGLSHLTAVSGQNLTYLLAALAPLLGRLRPVVRWTVTIGAILWFMSLTRFEPSILRAGVMAILASTAFVRGRDLGAVRALAGAVMFLVAIDPLLVWSVGFWLSVSATAGVVVAGPRLALIVPGPQWLRIPLGVTLGAQVGVAIPSLVVFGRLPLVALVANPAAVPVAGAVMVAGVPCAVLAVIVSEVLPDPVAGVGASLVMVPVEVATRWVAEVARVAATVEPAEPWPLLGWLVVVLAIGTRVARTRVQGSPA